MSDTNSERRHMNEVGHHEANELSDNAAARLGLPADPFEYWRGRDDAFSAPPQVETQPALKQLGPLPVARAAFPLMGFFASVYEHVSMQAREQLKRSDM